MTSAAERPQVHGWPQQLGLPVQASLNSGLNQSGAELVEADLRWALLAQVQLADVDLRRANLQGADLRQANLAGARLAAADLSAADLRGADLRRADLADADLRGADLRAARLDGADLTGVTWEGAWVDADMGLVTDSAGRVCTGGARAEQRAKDWLAQALAGHGLEDWPQTWQHYLLAWRWADEPAPALWGCGRLLASAGDVVGAAHLWQRILTWDPDADRARLDALLVAVALRTWSLAQTLASDFADRQGHWLARLASAVSDQDADAVGALVVQHLPDSAALAARPRFTAVVPPAQPPETSPAPTTQAQLVQALAQGDMAAAQRYAQRLPAAESAPWTTALRDLDLTEQAMTGWLQRQMPQLGSVQRLQWVALGPHGPTARVELASATMYAKRHSGVSRPLAAVQWQNQLCSILKSRGLPVPEPLPDGEGALAFAFAGDLLTASPALTGQPVASGLWSPQQAAAAGAMLARIHLVGAAEVIPPRPAHGLRSGTQILLAGEVVQALVQRAVASSTQQRWLQSQPQWQTLLALLPLAAERLQPLLPLCPTGLCHGDFGGGNLLWEADHVCGVVDWDLADVGPWVWDLARAVDLAAVDWPGRGLATAQVATAQLLVAGYQSVRQLSEPEQAALPLLVALSRLDLDADLLAHLGTTSATGSQALLQRAQQRVTRAAAGVPELQWALQSGLVSPRQVLAWHRLLA